MINTHIDTHAPHFPPVALATPEGLVAVGGDLSSERLLQAYRHGIFPWYNPGQPILWWSPDPRTVLWPHKLHIARSLRKTLRRGEFRVTFDHAFTDVIDACAGPRRRHPSGATWITSDMRAAYCRLHHAGHAHSVEIWSGTTLVGGLYGVALGAAFFGESMFSHATDASKVALVYLVDSLRSWGYTLIDCQVASPHLFSLGAEEIPRSDFILALGTALALPGHTQTWRGHEIHEVAV